MRLEPGLKPGLVKAAAISDNDGHVPGTLVAQVCARRVKEMGGRIVSNSPVTGLDMQAGRVASVQTSGRFGGVRRGRAGGGCGDN